MVPLDTDPSSDRKACVTLEEQHYHPLELIYWFPQEPLDKQKGDFNAVINNKCTSALNLLNLFGPQLH